MDAFKLLRQAILEVIEAVKADRLGACPEVKQYCLEHSPESIAETTMKGANKDLDRLLCTIHTGCTDLE